MVWFVARISIQHRDATYFIDINLMNFLSEYGIEGKRTGEEFIACCPFHDEKKPSFSMKLEGSKAGLWHCFSDDCNKRGNLVSLIMEMEGCSFDAAIASLVAIDSPAEITEDYLQNAIDKLKRFGISDQKEIEFPLPPGCINGTVKDYFTWPVEENGRGYTEDEFNQLETSNIRYCVDGYYRNQIILPIYDDTGRQISFVARNLNKDGQKFRYPKGWLKQLYVEELKTESVEPPLICEGKFDGIHIQGIWKRTALIIFGSSPSTTQVRRIARRYKRVILALDGDKAGRAGVFKGLDRLLLYGTEVDVLDIPETCDPPQLNKTQFEGLNLLTPKEFREKWTDITRLKRH